MVTQRTDIRENSLAFPKSQGMFKRLTESVKVGVYMTDANGEIFYVNLALVKMLGLNSKNDLIGSNLTDEMYIKRADREQFIKEMKIRGYIQDYKVHHKRADGTMVVLSVTSNFIQDSSGKNIGVEGIVLDITKSHELEESLKFEKNKLEQILAFDEKVCAIHEFESLVQFIVEKTSEILEVSKCSLMMLDDERKELMIKAAVGLDRKVIDSTRVKVGEQMAGIVVQEKKPMLIEDIESDDEYKRNNRPGYLSRSFMIVPIKIGTNVVGVINVAEKRTKTNYRECFDTMDLKILCALAREVSVAFNNMKLYEDLSFLAHIDPLTNIYNYRKFDKALEYEMNRSIRTGNHLCVMMVDVDDFKSYNDRFGHQEGDNLLKAIALVFKKCLRSTDIICRYGGDEFAIILPDTDTQGVKTAANKIKGELNLMKFKADVTLSFGVAKFIVGLTKYQLIKKADNALYRAKFEGRNRYFDFTI